jgi:hypothetical protein
MNINQLGSIFQVSKAVKQALFGGLCLVDEARW